MHLLLGFSATSFDQRMEYQRKESKLNALCQVQKARRCPHGQPNQHHTLTDGSSPLGCYGNLAGTRKSESLRSSERNKRQARCIWINVNAPLSVASLSSPPPFCSLEPSTSSAWSWKCKYLAGK